MLRAVIAPDKFKGSLTAAQAAGAIARGLLRGAAGKYDSVKIPMADGGEGTVETFLETGAKRVEVRAHGPLSDTVDATLALDGDTAILEMAAASGLMLVAPEKRDVLRATTYGTGEMICAALDAGANKIVVGIGGSATNDGGAGMLQALGVRLLDSAGRDVERGGAALANVRTIDLAGFDARLGATEVTVAADVDNPLCGPDGASAVYGPQKGATQSDVRLLDAALGNFADVTARTLGKDLRSKAGSGAAGGLGFALMAYLNAKLLPGVEVIARLRGLPAALDGASLVLTGEGRIDMQTLHGKTVAGVARLARAEGVRDIIAFGGTVEDDARGALAELGATAIPIADSTVPLEERLKQADALLERAAAREAAALGSR